MTTEPVLSQQPIRSVPHSGLRFPAISLGLWQNFGASAAGEDATALITTALDLGVFHLDLANNYGPHRVPQNLLWERCSAARYAPIEMKCSLQRKPDTGCGLGLTVRVAHASISFRLWTRVCHG